MKILLLTHYYEPEVGAPQRRWRSLVSAFTARGHRVAVIAPVPHYPHRRAAELELPPSRLWHWEDGARGERIMRVPYVPVSGSTVGQLLDQTVSSAGALAAAARLRQVRPDVVVSTTPGLPMPFTGAVAARLLGVPHVAEVRDAWPDLIADSQLVRSAARGLLPGPAVEYLERNALPGAFHAVLRSADALVTTTESFSAQMRSRGMKRVETIRNTTEVPAAAPRQAPRAPGEPLRLLYVGTVGRSQDLETVIRAVGRTAGVELRIVGAGVHWETLRELAAGLTDRIEFFPQTTGAALEAHWSWADSGVVSLADVPSFTRTIPSKLVSVMARGKHVLGVCAGEAAQIIEDSCGGDVVAPGDPARLGSVLERLRDCPEATRTDSRPREWLRRHASPDSAAEAYLSLLEEVRA